MTEHILTVTLLIEIRIQHPFMDACDLLQEGVRYIRTRLVAAGTGGSRGALRTLESWRFFMSCGAEEYFMNASSPLLIPNLASTQGDPLNPTMFNVVSLEAFHEIILKLISREYGKLYC